MPLVVPKFTEKEMAEIREAFDLFDKNKDGTISIDELKTVLKSLGIKSSDTQLMDMINSVDIDKNGVIDIQEFTQLMPSFGLTTSSVAPQSTTFNTLQAQHNSSASEQSKYSASEEEELRRAFREFDKDGNGYISQDELALVMETLDEKFTSDEIKAMVKEVDHNGDGHIDYNEFCKLYTGN